MTHHDIDAWLGDTPATDEQRTALDAAAAAITARYPDDLDEREDREQALTAAAEIILGDDTLDEIAARWRAARAREQALHSALTGALIAAAPGTSEVALAAHAGVTRMTVRKALGK